MATLLQLPSRAVAGARSALIAPIRPFLPADAVDDWGRDDHLIRQWRRGPSISNRAAVCAPEGNVN